MDPGDPSVPSYWQGKVERGTLELSGASIGSEASFNALLTFLSVDSSISTLIISNVAYLARDAPDCDGKWNLLFQPLFTHPTLSHLAIRECHLPIQTVFDLASVLYFSSPQRYPQENKFLESLDLFSFSSTEKPSSRSSPTQSMHTVASIIDTMTKPWKTFVDMRDEVSKASLPANSSTTLIRMKSRLKLHNLELFHVWRGLENDSDLDALRALLVALYYHSSIHSLNLFNNALLPSFALDVARLMQFEGRGRALSLGANLQLSSASDEPSSTGKANSIDSSQNLPLFWRNSPFSSQESRITSLNLSYTNVTNELLEILVNGLSVSQSIRRLVLSSNPIALGGEGMKELFAQLPMLKSLNLSYVSSSKDANLYWLCDNAVMPSLQELTLEWCAELSAFSLDKLAEALAGNYTLTSLSLQGNPLGRSSFRALADALCINKTLSVLNVGSCLKLENPEKDLGASLYALAFMLQHNFTLTELVLLTETQLTQQLDPKKPNEIGTFLLTLSKMFIQPVTASNSTLTSIPNESAWKWLRDVIEKLPKEEVTVPIKESILLSLDSLDYRLEQNLKLANWRRQGYGEGRAAYHTLQHKLGMVTNSSMYCFRPPVFETDDSHLESQTKPAQPVYQVTTSIDSGNSSSFSRKSGEVSEAVQMDVNASTTSSEEDSKHGEQHPQEVLSLPGKRKRDSFDTLLADPHKHMKQMIRSESKLNIQVWEQLVGGGRATATVRPEQLLRTGASGLSPLCESSSEKEEYTEGNSPYTFSSSSGTAQKTPFQLPSQTSLSSSGSHLPPLNPLRLSASSSLPLAPISWDFEPSLSFMNGTASKFGQRPNPPFLLPSLDSTVVRLCLVGLGMTHVPDHVDSFCANLVELDLRNNKIERVPAKLGNLLKLSSLLLSHNNLDSVHWCLGDLIDHGTLQNLSLQHNPLRLVPYNVKLEMASPRHLISKGTLKQSLLYQHLQALKSAFSSIAPAILPNGTNNVIKKSILASTKPLQKPSVPSWNLTALSAEPTNLHCRMMILGDSRSGRTTLRLGLRVVGDEAEMALSPSSNASTDHGATTGSKKTRDRSKSKGNAAASSSNSSVNFANLAQQNGAKESIISYFQTHYRVISPSPPSNASSHHPFTPTPLSSSSKRASHDVTHGVPLLQSDQAVQWMCYDFPDGLQAVLNLFMAGDMVFLVVLNAANARGTIENRMDYWVNVIYQSVSRDHNPTIYFIGTHVDKIPDKERKQRMSEIAAHFRNLTENLSDRVDCLFVNSTSSSLFKESLTPDLHIHSLYSLAAELSRKTIATGKCVKKWPLALDSMASIIRGLSHAAKPSFTKASSAKSSSTADQLTELHQQESLMPLQAITALISHFGFKGDDIMRIVYSLEEAGALLYFGRSRNASFGTSSTLSTGSTPQHQPSSSDQLLSNLVVVDPEYCCRLLSLLSSLKPSESGLIEASQARSVLTQDNALRISRNQLTASSSGSSIASVPSAHSTSSQTSSIAKSPSVTKVKTQIDPEIQMEMDVALFWALLEVTGLAIRVQRPSSLPPLIDGMHSILSTNTDSHSSDTSNRVLSTKSSFTISSSSYHRHSVNLALQLNAVMDTDARAELNARTRRKSRFSTPATLRPSSSSNLQVSPRILNASQSIASSNRKAIDTNTSKTNTSSDASSVPPPNSSTVSSSVSNTYRMGESIFDESSCYLVPHLLDAQKRPAPWTDLRSLVSLPIHDESQIMHSTARPSAHRIRPQEIFPSTNGEPSSKNSLVTFSAPSALVSPRQLANERNSPKSSSPEMGEKLNYYQRLYRFGKFPFALNAQLLRHVLSIAGLVVLNPYGKGFEVHMGEEKAQIFFLDEYKLFLDVVAFPSGSLLWLLDQTVHDILEGWFDVFDLDVTMYIGYRYGDADFCYEKKSVIMDAIQQGKREISFPLRKLLDIDASLLDNDSTRVMMKDTGKAKSQTSADRTEKAMKYVEVTLDEVVPDQLMKSLVEHQIDVGELRPVSGNLGSGGFGTVLPYHYRDTLVAVKAFKSGSPSVGDPTGDVRALKELHHEVRIMALLGDCDYLVALKGWMFSPPQIVLEHLAGGKLWLGTSPAALAVPMTNGIIRATSNPWTRCKLPSTFPSSGSLPISSNTTGPQAPGSDTSATATSSKSGEISKSSAKSQKSAKPVQIQPQPFMHDNEAFWEWTCSLRSLLDVSKGMQHMHSKNVLHRDLFLFNVIRTSSTSPLDFGTPFAKVIDFGMARSMVGGGETGKVTSERYYIMSPEVRDASNPVFKPESDVFSYSTMMYQLYVQQFMLGVSDSEMVRGHRSELPFLPGWPASRKNLASEAQRVQSEIEKYLDGKGKRTATARNLQVPQYALSYMLHSLFLFERLLKECWAQNAEQRPTFAAIARQMSVIIALWSRTLPPRSH